MHPFSLYIPLESPNFNQITPTDELTLSQVIKGISNSLLLSVSEVTALKVGILKIPYSLFPVILLISKTARIDFDSVLSPKRGSCVI